MCELNRRVTDEGQYCARGCPKCNPTGQNPYAFIITTDPDGDGKYYQMCTECDFKLPSGQLLQYHEKLGILN